MFHAFDFVILEYFQYCYGYFVFGYVC